MEPGKARARAGAGNNGSSPRRGWERGVEGLRAAGDVTYVFNGGVDKVQLMAAAAAEDALDPETARQQLGQVLTAARVAAGKPKLATLAREIGYSESMLSRVLNGHLVPSRDRLERLAEHLDVDMRAFTSVWVPLWEAANRRPGQKPATPEPSAGPPGFECPACGSWVTNPARHIEWHMLPDSGQNGGSVTRLRPVQ
jgi:transcriptional regulator with XRE-family HTH domain